MIKYLVYGFGITGKAVAKHLKNENVDFDICDKNNKSEDILSPKEIDIKDYSHIVVSPGISPEDELVVNANVNGIKITSELQMAYDILSPFNNKFIAVTGTNGKSTVASLIYSLIKNGSKKDVFLNGNIGSPLIERVSERPKDSFFIIEISSYQAEYLFDFSPDIVLLLNLSPDHLARHKTMQCYHDAKTSLLDGMDQGTVLYDDRDFDIRSFDKIEKKVFKKDFYIKEQSFYYDASLIYKDLNWKLPGEHNKDNIAFSLACLQALGLSSENVKIALEDFTSLEHRIENIYDDGSLSIYNDSKATTFESTLAAVSSFNENVHLIICGRLKEGMNIDQFLKRLVEYKNIDKIIILGDVNDDIEFNSSGKLITSKVDWYEFFSGYLKKTKKGVLLFSPGMPSFDMFKNFEERGRFFKKVISSILKKTN